MNKFWTVIFALLIFTLPASCYEEDFIVEEFLSDKNLEKPAINDKYDYQSTNFSFIKLAIIEPVKSERDLYEGQILKFKVAEDVIKDDFAIIKKDTVCTARVETIIANGMNGIPASIIIGNFEIPGVESNKLQTEYEKYGMDLSLLVFPVKFSLV